jgi:opacity protein-like surface antigen
MRMTMRTKQLFIVGLLALASLPALAAPPYEFYPNPFYIGVQAGQANLRDDSIGFHHRDPGWTVVAGVRPIPYVGAEVSYIDLGGQHDYGYCDFYCYSGSDYWTRGGAAFGVLYLPLPMTIGELYGKAGAARLQTHTIGVTTANCYGYGPCPGNYGTYGIDRTNTGFAWGAGAQLHWWNLAFRAEYEQFENQNGRPNLVSVGVFWTF